MLILNVLTGLEDEVYKKNFGNLDIRSEISRYVLKKDQGFEITDFEANLLLKTITFEVAKIIGKLETQTGVITGIVQRTKSGTVIKQDYGL